MQIVIELAKEQYDALCMKGVVVLESQLPSFLKALRNGIVLPKGHGDLIARSKIYKAIYAEEDNCTGMGMTLEEMDAYNDGIDVMYSIVQSAPPLIPADKGVEN